MSGFSWDVVWHPGGELPAGRAGDPGLFGPRSLVWRVTRERVLLAAGPAALLLQVAHPLVAAGVAEHSAFAEDPFARLRATLSAILVVTFGDGDQAARAAERVRATHRRVRGRLGRPLGPFPAQTPYRASDPELAMWVHASLVHTALQAYAALVEPLGATQRARYYEEVKPVARLFGVTAQEMPAGYDQFRRYFREMTAGQTLRVDGAAREIGRALLDPPVPFLLRPAADAVRALTPGFLPQPVRAAFGFPGGPLHRAGLGAVRATVRTAVPRLPARLRFWPHYLTALRRAAQADPDGSLRSGEGAGDVSTFL